MIKTAIFDFDSTLISVESLEVLLAPKLSPEKLAQVQRITEQGMNGTLSFAESLQQRLAIAAPTQQDLHSLAKTILAYLTPGIAECIEQLHKKSVAVWIISGGLREVILPIGLALNIPAPHIHGVQLRFSGNGHFLDLDAHDAFSRSKVEGAQLLSKQWQAPSVMIGDGFTDYEVYQAGLVDHFIAFTQHRRRSKVLQQLHVLEASSVQQLNTLLFDTLSL